MKIMQILNHPGQGGAEQYAYLLAKGAKESGHEVMFIFGEEGPLVEKIKSLKIPYEFVKMRAPYDPIAVTELVKAMKKFQPDVIQTHFMRENFLAVDASFFAPVKAIFTSVHRLEQKTAAQAMANRIYSRKTKSLIATSELARGYLLNEGISKYKIVVILNGAEVKKINCEEIRDGLLLKKNEKMITYVGRFTREKGHNNLIKAFKKAAIKNAKLVLVGDGELLPAMKKLAADCKNIIFTGGKDNGYEYIGASDLYIQPSKIENMPLSVIEAMLYGVPILASDVPGHRLILKDRKYGEFFRQNKVDELAEKIGSTLDSKEAINKAKEAREYANTRLTAEKMWQETEKLYEKYV